MKKLILTGILMVSLLGINSTNAYTPPETLESKLKTVTQKIDTIIEKKGENYSDRFLIILKEYREQYTENERAEYILNYLIDYVTIEKESCIIYDDFSDPDTNSRRIINDGVMGGLSKGNITNKNNSLIFSGNINTNGGGFTSIRSPLGANTLSSTDYIKIRLKSDIRSYKLTFRDSYSTGVSYQADILSQTPGVSEDVNISFSELKANYFGRSIDSQAFNKLQALELGFIISDGIDGAFELEIEKVEFCGKV